MNRLTKLLSVLCLSVGTVMCATAAPIPVTSYSMNNGATGSFNYRDFSYSACNGQCDTTGAALSGGTGKLTDGFWPLYDWYAWGDKTPWLGWDASQGQTDPFVTFSFDQISRVDSISLWLSNTLDGGVSLPRSVLIDGISYDIAPDGTDANIREVIFSGLNLVGSSHTLQFNQAPGSPWVMVGEVAFNGTTVLAVPEPSSGSMVLAALGAFAVLGWRRRQAK